MTGQPSSKPKTHVGLLRRIELLVERRTGIPFADAAFAFSIVVSVLAILITVLFGRPA